MSELVATAVQKENQWTVTPGGEWKPFVGTTKTNLEPGLYELVVVHGMFGTDVYLQRMKLATDKILALPGSLCEYIVNSITKFWESKDLYSAMGLIHKRGILMEGPPGTGKTAICLLTGEEIGKRGGVAIFVSPATDVAALPRMLQTIRQFHPNLPLVNMIEDLDRHIPADAEDRYDIRKTNARSTLLSLLDGENQIPNVLHLATTNYIERIDHTFTNRPSRYDEVIKVKPPVKSTRTAYLKAIIPSSTPAASLTELVRHSKGLNFAHIKELAISHVVYGRAIDKTSARLRALAENRGTGFETELTEEEDND